MNALRHKIRVILAPLIVSIVFGGFSVAFAAMTDSGLNIYGTSYTASRQGSTILVQVQLEIRNESNREQTVFIEDFRLKQEGANAVRARNASNGGGFWNGYYYDTNSAKIFPGDKIKGLAVFDLSANTEIGAKVFYSEFGNLYQISTLR